jgi:hypothetical protein
LNSDHGLEQSAGIIHNDSFCIVSGKAGRIILGKQLLTSGRVGVRTAHEDTDGTGNSGARRRSSGHCRTNDSTTRDLNYVTVEQVLSISVLNRNLAGGTGIRQTIKTIERLKPIRG